MFGKKDKRQANLKPTDDICLNDGIQNAAEALLANVRFSSVDNPIKTVAVTSSVPNEGKTTVAVALAIAIGRRGLRCLILECDMRRRSVRGVLGVHTKRGIHAVLTGECSYQEAITYTKFQNVSFLDAEYGIPNPDGILSSHRFDDLLDDLAGYYDYVIIDTPPVEAFADASIVASKVDGTIVVAREDYTDKREIVHGLNQLDAAGANVLGVSLNGVKTSAGGYGYYYSYYYDEDGNKKKSESSSAAGNGRRGKKSRRSKDK